MPQVATSHDRDSIKFRARCRLTTRRTKPPPINHPPGLAPPPPHHFSSIDDPRVWAMGEGLLGLLAHSWPRKTSLRTGSTRHQRPSCHPSGDHPV